MDAVKVGITVVSLWLAKEGTKQVLMRIGTAIALSAISQALNKPKTGPASGVQQQRQIGTNVPREIVVGETIVAGSEVALWSSGNNDPAGANVTNTRVICLGDWPCDLIEVIWKGQVLTFEGDISTGWFACNQFIGKKNRKRFFARFYNGDWDQPADATLIGKAVAGSAWGSADRLRGSPYFALYRHYDPDAFPNGRTGYERHPVPAARSPHL
jgi:hypothetical protein